MKKFLAKALLTATLAASSAGAMADAFPDFTVNPSTYAPGKNSFVADKVIGNYSEWISFTSPTTFAASILWEAGNFVANGGTTSLNANKTGLGSHYGMYGLYQGVGTISNVGSTATFTITSGNLSLILDKNVDSDFSNFNTVGNGYTPWAVINGADDIVLATGTATSGSGALNTGCSGGINCGSYGQTSALTLTAAGKNFFTQPVPFYNIAFQSGQFNLFQLSGDQQTNGSMDVVFNNVPEPTSVALLGLGLLGLGFSARRRNSK